ncbi:MAG: hypothetical protein BMS9Abin37_0651 [Acidobacteriota bacterium]|nr:MAG: hypothetical protein BMS9Abin37_0651 [Acidobacteriota bacterium]
MSPLAATLATIAIFFAPGVLLVSALSGRDKIALSLGEKLYLTVASSVLLSGWVGLTLAEIGRFSPARVAAAVAILVAVAALTLFKQLSFASGSRGWRELLVATALLAFTLVAYYPPYEYILGGRDPGIYVNTGFHLAREGNLTFTDPVIASIPEEDWALFFRVDKELPDWKYLRFQGYRLENPSSARVAPHGLHLYPTWIATAAAMYEMKAGLYATPFFAMLGVLGLFFALNRIFGFEIAAWASAFLTVFQIQVWFARFPNSEVVVQFLYATALMFFFFMEEKRSTIAGAAAGVALGSTLLARMENVLFLVPIALVMGWKRLKRELDAPELAFLGGFSVLALHAAVHDRFVSWPYVSSILGRHYWRILGDHLWVVAALGIIGFVVVDRLARRAPSWTYTLVQSNRFRIGAALALFALAAFTYFVRPFWHGPRTARHDAEAFLRMSWYLYPVGLALAVSGAMMLLVRARKTQVFFLLTGLTFSLFFFYKVRVWHDHYFAMRRFIPVILPSLVVCMSVFLMSLRSDARRFTAWGARVIAATLLVIYLVDGRALWAFGGHEEFPGSLDFVEELARHIGDNDVVIFPRREGLHMLELPLSELEGKHVLEFYSLKPPRDRLEDLLVQWRDEYRDIYFVTNYKVSLSGLFTQHVQDFWFATQKYEYTYTRPPSAAEPFHLRFTLSKAVDLDDLAERVPKLPDIDIGGSDDVQVAWFHEKELDEEGTSYRWSEQTSSIFLPAVGKGTKTLHVRLAGPREDEAPLHSVEIAIEGLSLGSITPSRDFKTYELEIPPELQERADATYAILTLSTETWRPSNSITGATDVRELGVRVDSIEVR